MDNSVASVSREFRVACPGRGPKMPDPQFSEFLAQNWRYKDGTTRDCSFVFSVVPYRALQCDRCLVITTGSNRSAPFHGGNMIDRGISCPNGAAGTCKVCRRMCRTLRAGMRQY